MTVNCNGANEREVQSNEGQGQNEVFKGRSFTRGINSRVSSAMKHFLAQLDRLSSKVQMHASCLKNYCIRMLQQLEKVPLIKFPIKLLIYGMRHCSIGLFALMISLGGAVWFKSLSILFISCSILIVLIALALINKIKGRYEKKIESARRAAENVQFVYDQVDGVMQVGIRLSNHATDVRTALSVATNTVGTYLSSWMSNEESRLEFHDDHFEEHKENDSGMIEEAPSLFLDLTEVDEKPILMLHIPELSVSSLANGMLTLFQTGKRFLVGDVSTTKEEVNDLDEDYGENVSICAEFFDALEELPTDDEAVHNQASNIIEGLNIT